VDGDLQRDRGFTAHGEVNLRAARFAGRLSFRGAVLAVAAARPATAAPCT
jgi:hypothetical protein